ncbi:SWIM zinc finger family protein [uncultured Methanospirillum sp.]|uniref:SWIM zinc finger family protein n=1 Tax=uncultured Methanospirillum sp. TaxID=262503 RepID=UPI0029C749D3|nr:SWIM zinc finger family protein [uncultured Methanospirillum sp.]
MMGFYYYEKTSPRPVKDGIKAKSRKGSIGQKWWSQKFLDALHEMGMDNRLARGRAYARKGQVINLTIKEGSVQAKVQGSSPKPYSVSIGMQNWDSGQWDRVFEEISSQAIYSAQLLAGEMPSDINDLILKAGLTLFPGTDKDLKTSCSCPGYANPCKHIAAVYYILAERFDEDPFLLFAMRGRTKDQILEELNARRGADDNVSSDASPDIVVRKDPEELTVTGFYSFRSPIEGFKVYPGAEPPVKGLTSKRLSGSPFEAGKKNLADLLLPFYVTAPAFIRRIIHGDEPVSKENS